MVTCWERADLLALVGDVYCLFFFVTFPCNILGHVWYFIVSFPDCCRLSFFVTGSRYLTAYFMLLTAYFEAHVRIITRSTMYQKAPFCKQVLAYGKSVL